MSRLIPMAGLLLAACSSAVEPAHPGPLEVIEWDGTGQDAVVGQPLDKPMVAEVRDLNWRTVPGIRVSWRVIEGQGRFGGSPVTVTDAAGRASIRFIPSTGRSLIIAEAEGGDGSRAEFRTLPAGLATYKRAVCASSSSCEEFRFYADGTFLLAYPGPEFTGQVVRTAGSVTLRFDAEPRWDAVAILGGDSLALQYGADAQEADFVGGVFRLIRGTPLSP